MALLDADYSNVDPALADAARKLIAASGGRVRLNSGYRSPERQAQLYAQGLARWGPNLVSKHVAKPGSSQHNFGRAVDLGGDLALAARLAPQYGLSQLLPDTDPVHFELIGNRSRGKVMSAGTPGRTQVAMPSSATATRSVQAPAVRAPNDEWKKLLLASLSQPDEQTPQYNPDELVHQPLDLRMAAGLTDEEGDLRSNADLAARIRARAQSNAPNVQLAQAQARATAADPTKNPKLQELLTKMQGYIDNLQTQQPYVLPTAPTRKTEAIPTRGNARPNTLARIAAAIGGLIKPGSAGQFGAAELGAENEGADRDYQDALTRYKLATEQDTQAYEDQANERNLMIRNDEANRQTALQDQLRKFGYNRDLINEQVPMAEEAAQAGPLAEAQGALQRTNAAEELARGLEEKEQRRLQAAQLAATAGSRAATTRERALQALATLENKDALAEFAANNKLNMADAVNQLKAAIAGYQYTPGGKPGAPPAITPTARGDLSEEAKSKIELRSHQQKAADAMAAERAARTTQIKTGKAAAAVKALPAIDPEYASLVRDYTLKNRAIQHDQDKADSPFTAKAERIKAYDRIAANAAQMKRIKTNMDTKEQAYLARTSTTPPSNPMKGKGGNAAARKRSGNVNGKSWVLEP